MKGFGKHKRRKRKILLYFLVVFGCSQPSENEQFVRADEAPDGVYCFALDFADTLASYDLSFYTKSPDAPLRLEVIWMDGESPAGLSESVWMQAGELRQLYRSGIKPQHPGDWKLRVRVPGQPDGFPGLGLITKRNDGTR